MQELTQEQQQMISAGFGLGTVLICIVVGTGVYKIFTSSRGRISVPWFISMEWSR